VTGREILFSLVALVIGWVANDIRDAVLGWLYETTGWAGSLLWDALAVVGILAVVGAGWWYLH
jgi:hypothetical protein